MDPFSLLLGVASEPDERKRTRASWAVAAYARDPDDCRFLLEAIGLAEPTDAAASGESA